MSSRTQQLSVRYFSVWVVLLSFVASTAAPGLREGDYYRPLPPEASGRVTTTATYRRSPCPALNALANHGFIARDGKAISAQMLKVVLMKQFNVDSRYADTLVALAKKPVFDLDELSAHNVVEHDMSMVHKDAFFGQDPAVADPGLIDDFFGHVGASGILDPWFFARTQQRRLRDCMTNNPQCEFSNEFLLSVTLGRQGLLMRVMGSKNQEAVDLDTAKLLLVEEKIASNWTKSSIPIAQSDIQDTRMRMFALLKASGEWLGDGFGTTSQQLVSDANVTQCLRVVNKTVVLSTCDDRVATQKFLLDGQQQLRVATGGCVQVTAASTATGASVVEGACQDDVEPTQQWRYDASGRLRPVHAPDLCLDLVKTQIVTATCSTRTEQRFFSYYSNFQPSGSRVASMDTPHFCLGLEGSVPTTAVDLSPVVLTLCDTMDETQELTLDESKRLVFDHDKTQCVDVSTNDIVQKPCSSDSTTWRYDSLSRLRPRSVPSKCIQLSGPTQQKLLLADCADEISQKWFIADIRNADIRPADQYYRPNVFESSGKPGTAAAYSRSPCPALNTLANHGFLPRSGRNLTAQQVKQAVVDHFNIDPAYAQVLVDLANRTVFNLDDLSTHNAAEHDMSLVHADAFFGQDPAVSDPTLVADLFRHVGASGNMDMLFFARTQSRRLKDCQARNPQCDYSNEFLMSVALGRLGLLMRGMGGRNEDLVGIDNVRSFLVDEKFPANFTKSPTPVTQAQIQETRIHIYSLLKSSREWLVDGFLNSKTSVPIVSEGGGHVLCLSIANGSIETNAPLVVADCNPSKGEQKWLMDDLQRMVSDKSGLCLTALGKGRRVLQTECADDSSNQLWTYDSSGRLRPADAADMCLTLDRSNDSVISGNSVTLDACAATIHQRFYSIYNGFQPNVSHLNSIEIPELCVSVANASTNEHALVQVMACDPLLLEQQLSMDTSGRLVFKHSDKCLAVSSTNHRIEQATCATIANQLWHYDSLGRLHPASGLNQCLALPPQTTANTSTPVVLVDCSDVGTQRWYASDATDPNNRPQNTYYRPIRDESSGWVGTTATYSRSPCPALNTLANHGLVSRDGRNISRMDLIGAAVATFNLDSAIAESFFHGLQADYINLDQLSDPRTFSYPGSLVHSDAFFNPDPASIDPDLVNDLFARVGTTNTIDLLYLAMAQRRRLNSTATFSAIKAQKPGLLLRVLGNADGVSADQIKQLMVEERIPENFTKPSAVISANDVLASANIVHALVETTDFTQSQPFQPVKEPIFAMRGTTMLCLNLANGGLTLTRCNATDPAQQFTYDTQERLVVEGSGSCLDVVDGKLGDDVGVNHVDCTDWPHQQWAYDTSGRLHPQHGPKYCLRIGSSQDKGTIAKCSDASDQVFFTTSSRMVVREKQFVSVAPSGLTQCLRTTSGGLDVRICDSVQPEQLFTLDGGKRLIAQGINKCVAVGTNRTQVDMGDCGTSPAWTYDSLGRVHVLTAMGQCLAADSNPSNPVTMEACTTAATQKWVVARLTVPPPNEADGNGTSKESATNDQRQAGYLALALALLVGISHQQ